MPNPNSRSTVRPAWQHVPGRPIDTAFGGVDPDLQYLFTKVGELKEDAAQVGAVTIPDAGFTADDLLVFDGTAWQAVDKTALLALSDLTDVILTSPVTNDLLRFDGVAWVNTPMDELLALDDLSDVTLTAPATGAFLVKTGTDWVDQNFTPGRLGVGTTGDPTHRLEMEDGDHTAWFTGSGSLGSTAAGLRMSKVKTQTGEALGLSLHSDGAPCWEWMMAADTDNALRSGFGNADFGLWDYSAGGFCLRISPEEAGSSGVGTKFYFGEDLATPRAFDRFVTMVTPVVDVVTLAVKAMAAQTAALLQARDASDNVLFEVGVAGHVTLRDAVNVILGTSTGTQIGTGATQKHALWGKTPIVQPTALTAADNTAIDATFDATEQAVVENLRTRLNEMETRLTSWGFLP